MTASLERRLLNILRNITESSDKQRENEVVSEEEKVSTLYIMYVKYIMLGYTAAAASRSGVCVSVWFSSPFCAKAALFCYTCRSKQKHKMHDN